MQNLSLTLDLKEKLDIVSGWSYYCPRGLNRGPLPNVLQDVPALETSKESSVVSCTEDNFLRVSRFDRYKLRVVLILFEKIETTN